MLLEGFEYVSVTVAIQQRDILFDSDVITGHSGLRN